MIDEPSLFDVDEDQVIALGDDVDGGAPCTKGGGENPPRAPQSEWREVSLDVFLHWSEKQKLEYCAARDLDSAEFADNETDMQWFLERAKWYAERAATL